jgi:heme-degrading monooxygenase HmoA
MTNIVRVFHAITKPGKEEEFQSFFLDDAVPILRGHEGLVSVQVGLPTAETPRQFLMITTWSSMEALVGFAGPNWQSAVIDDREAHLLAETRVHHYLEASL